MYNFSVPIHMNYISNRVAVGKKMVLIFSSDTMTNETTSGELYQGY